MKIPLRTWQGIKGRYGDYEARRRMAYFTKRHKAECLNAGQKRDPLSLVMELVHTWNMPMESRKRHAMIIRELCRASREHRHRIAGFCAPGVSTRRLP